MSLYDANKKSELQITALPQINLLESMGLRVGTNVAVQTRYAFGGPVLLRVEDSFLIALGKDIAQQIAVKEVAV
jgi:Fe2+ transport system protein FeoA